MTRREFVSLAGGTAVAWPLMAQAQEQTVSTPRIAYLGASSPAVLDPRQIEQFKVGLTENGLIDGQNIKVDYLWGEGSSDRLRQHAADLAKRNLSVIVTAGPQPVRALLEAKVSSPIVFAILSDPIGDGFVQSLARPGGNLTGLSMVGTDLESKRLQILKDAVPAVTKVMLLYDPTMGSTIGLEEAKSSAPGLGLEILIDEVADVDKLASRGCAAKSKWCRWIGITVFQFQPQTVGRSMLPISVALDLGSHSLHPRWRSSILWSQFP
jgi:putative ABC transport system substrate-binding protein